MKPLSALMGAFALMLLAGCGGGSGQSFAPAPQPVQAQSGFSNASLDGLYGVSFVGANVGSGAIQEVLDGIATANFNGQGGMTSGSLTEYTSSGTCTYTISGTYSISITGAATWTVTAANPSPSTCPSGATQFSGTVSQSGDMAVFAESDGASTGGFLSGTAIKQQ